MKRDMELIRELLMSIENQEKLHQELSIPDGVDKEIVVYHLGLMEEAGLTNNNIRYADNQPFWIYSNLTWEGHDFLESIKNDTIWNKIKESIKTKGLDIGEVSFGVLKEFVKVKLKETLGIN